LRAKYHVGVSGLCASLRDLNGPKELRLIAVQVDDREQLLSAIGALVGAAGDLLADDRALIRKRHEVEDVKGIFFDGLHEFYRLQDAREAKRKAEVVAEQREYERLAKRRGRVAHALAEFEGLPDGRTVALVPRKRAKR
jgi:hypothetical protein